LTGETRKAFLNRVGTIKKYMNKASLILGAGLITAAVVTVVVISSGGGGSNKKAAATSNEVTIGKQVWMTENLNVDTFRNGEPIP